MRTRGTLPEAQNCATQPMKVVKPEPTLKQAKEHLRQNFDKGVNCPCCRQFVKLYKRTVSSVMAYGLIVLYKKVGVGKEFHLEETLIKHGILDRVRSDFPKLRYWGLVEQVKGIRDDGSSRNGHYYITEKGRDFVNDELGINKNALIYNNQCYGSEGEIIGVQDALKKKFNYNELMGYEN